jgi:hypothetical protein
MAVQGQSLTFPALELAFVLTGEIDAGRTNSEFFPQRRYAYVDAER